MRKGSNVREQAEAKKIAAERQQDSAYQTNVVRNVRTFSF